MENCKHTLLRNMCFFLLGAGTLTLFSFLQKCIIGAKLFYVHGYLIPSLFGGISGLVIGRSIYKIKKELEERKWAEKEQKESEEKFRSITEQMTETVFLTDEEGVVTYISLVAEDLFGYLPGEMENLHFTKFLEDGNIEIAVKAFRETMKTGHETKNFNLKMKRKDGSSFFGQLTARPFLKQDKVAGTIGIIRDITDRKRVEEALQKSEERYRIAAELLPDPIFVHRQGRIFFANRAALDILGMSSMNEIRGRYVWEFNTSQDQIELAKKRAVRMESEGSVTWQRFDLKRPDGKEISIEALGRSLSFPDGKAILTVWRDLTDRLRAEKEKETLEAQLRQAQKMEALGTLAGGIAHDFNNILAAIMGYSELALEQAEEDHSDPSCVEEILKAGDRAKDLVNQILTFSRKLKPDLEYTNLNNVADQTGKMLKSMIPKMISIEKNQDPDLWLVNADQTQLSQVLMNLGSNAKDAMPDGGRLTINTKNITIDRECGERRVGVPAGNYVQLIVSDTGHGMDRETLKQIFDPFFTRKEVGKGTGLGLATVYGIVKNHGGYIICHSELGRGTTFEIYLPALCRAVGPEQRQVVKEDKIENGSETIMIVDDEEMLRNLGRQILSRQGYRVYTVQSGEEALAKYGEGGEDIDLVILDISMPGMGGHKCLEQLVRMNPCVKVVISSGYSLSGRLKDITSQGASGVVPKPFGRLEMLRTVREVLDG